MRLIDGDKLLKALEKDVELVNYIKSGRFDIPSNQGEARLREALEDIRRMEFAQVGHSTWITEQIDHVLSSPTEDKGIQKVRELYEIACEDENVGYQNGIRAAIKNLGITIPGITDGGDNNA